ncbi:MAG TPA: hypothetical protein VIH03_09375 [Nitrososphaerales archaeon]
MQDSPSLRAERAIINFLNGHGTKADEQLLIKEVEEAKKLGLMNKEVFTLTQKIELDPKYKERLDTVHNLPRRMYLVRRILKA